VPVPYTQDHAEHFVTVGTGALHSWVIIRSDAPPDSEVGVGTLAIHHVDDGAAEVGYWVAPWARRSGVATWALVEVRLHVASLTGASSITLTIAEANTASRRAAERAGFVLVPQCTARAVDDGSPVAAACYRLSLDNSAG